MIRIPALTVLTVCLGLIAVSCAPESNIGQTAQAISINSYQITPTENIPPPNGITQAEPAATFFGAPDTTNPIWVICYNDDTHKGDPEPDASGITCALLNGQGIVSQRMPILGQAPFATGNPMPIADPSVARDPVDPNVVWLTSLMRWDSATIGHRQSVGLVKLVYDPTTQTMAMNEPNPGCCGDAHRMVPIGGDGIEGPTDPTKGPHADRPFFAVDPTADSSGYHAQYIVLFQNDNSVSPHRGRIAMIRRKDFTTRFWDAPIVVGAEGLTGGPDGYLDDVDMYQFMAPRVVVHPTNHQVAVTFVRIQLEDNGTGDPSIINSATIDWPVQYFFGVSQDQGYSTFIANNISLHGAGDFFAGSVAPSDQFGVNRFTMVPYPVTTFAPQPNGVDWSLGVMTAVHHNGGNTGGWDVVFTQSSDGENWSPAVTVPRWGTTDEYGYDFAFPAAAYDPVTHQTFLHGLVAAENSRKYYAPIYMMSGDGGLTWSPPATLMGQSQPIPAHANVNSWGGFWANEPRYGYFGDYSAAAAVNGQFLAAWTDSRGEGSVQTSDIFAAVLR